MDVFTLIVVAALVALVAGVVLLGLFHPRSGAEILDWKPTRSAEREVELELDEVDQMLAAQNERRRRRGLPERTEDEVEAEVRRHQRELDEYAAAYHAQRAAAESRRPR